MSDNIKSIGIVMSALDSDMMINVCRGIRNRAEERGISTFVSAIAPSDVADSTYNRGEYIVYEKMAINHVDAFIVALNTFQDPIVRNLVMERVVNMNKPMIAVDCEVPGAFSLLSANYNAMRQLMDHMITVHGYRKINFISGPEDNTESKDRTEAYLMAMSDHNIPVDPKRIFEGCFYVHDGKASLDYFEANDTLLDAEAIVCSNDIVALSVMSELKKRGIMVPDQIAVTGFDDIVDGGYEDVSLTTIRKPDYEMGVKAVDMLERFFAKGRLQDTSHLDSVPIIRESCGCYLHKEGRRASVYSKTPFGRGNDFLYDFYADCELFRAMGKYSITRLMKCENFDSYVEELKQFVNLIRPGEFYVYVYTKYVKELKIDISRYGIEEELTFADDEVFTPFVYRNHTFMPGSVYRESNILRSINEDQGKQYSYSPIHFTSVDYGFVIIADSEYPFMKHAYWEWMSGLSSTINNLYYNLQLRDAIRKLNELYITDSLTRLYNRFGLTQFWGEFAKECDENGTPLILIFLDMNGLKKINDAHGHEAGDFSIYSIADAMRDAMTDNSVGVRYGGDEFLVLVKNARASQASAYVKRLDEAIEKVNRLAARDYDISASIGYFVVEDPLHADMMECIEKADRQMYINKKYRKEHTK